MSRFFILSLIGRTSSNKIIDKQTGSEWNFDDITVSGHMKGKKLMRLAFDEGFWFEWDAFHPSTTIYPR